MKPYDDIWQQMAYHTPVLLETKLPNRQKGQVSQIKRKSYTMEQLNFQETPMVIQKITPKVTNQDEILFLEPFFPKERLIVFGGGHIALPLVKMAVMVGFQVTVIDDRPSFANSSRFPEAAQVICDDFRQVFLQLDIRPNDFLVVITRGHKHDETCLREILTRPETIYTGMIGSKRRVATVFDQLKAAGFDQERLDRICSPVGLAIGAVTPEEISVSIVAQLIARKRLDSVKGFNGGGAIGVNRSDLDSDLLPFLAQQQIEPCALVTVMETKGSTPRGAGAKMIVFETGRILGSIGGGCSESKVMHTAISVIGTGQYELVFVDMTQEEAEEEGMVCGGTMTVLIEDFCLEIE